jgi:CarD family transcriptional regulator
MNSLKVGDKVIYPNQGLGVIEAILEESYNGELFRLVHLRIISNNTLVLVPSSTAEEIGIRRPIAEASIKKIFQFMKTEPVDVTMNWKGRYKEHVNLKSLYYLSLIKTLSFREKKMMEKAKELIISEISESSCLSCHEIEQKLLHTLSRCFKDVKPRVDI